MKTRLAPPFALAALFAAASAAPGVASAAITVFTSPAGFLAAVGASGTDDFTGFSLTGITPGPVSRSAGAFGYSAETGVGGFFGGGTEGNPFLSTSIYSDAITVLPAGTGVAGIAGEFFGSGFDGQYTAGPITVTVIDSLGATVSQTLSPPGATADSFLGFVSSGSITALTIASAPAQVEPFVWPSVDNLTLAAAIPEPGSYALMLGGLGLVGFLARRRRAD